MNKLRYCVIALLIFCLTGCYEVNEEITIDDNGAGTYFTKMDMSSLLQIMQSMGGEDELTKNGLDRPIDTTIYLKTFLDSSQNPGEDVKNKPAVFTPEQKRLLNDGSMHLQMNVKDAVLKTEMNFPFKSFQDLQSLMSGSSTAGLAQVFKKLFSGPDSAQSSSPDQSSTYMENQGLDQLSNIFDVTVTNGSIIKKLNMGKYKELMDRPEMAQIKQMTSSGFEVMYTTVIKLPRPVKKSDNPIIKLSDDKKTVTLKYDMMKIFDAPEKFSYAIYY